MRRAASWLFDLDQTLRAGVPRVVFMLAFAYWVDMAIWTWRQPIWLGVPTGLIAVLYLLPFVSAIGREGIALRSFERATGEDVPRGA